MFVRDILPILLMMPLYSIIIMSIIGIESRRSHARNSSRAKARPESVKIIRPSKEAKRAA